MGVVSGRRCAAIVLGLGVACSGPAATPPPRRAPVVARAPEPLAWAGEAPARLPRSFEPTSYDARLAIRDEHRDAHFTGRIQIDGRLTEDVAMLWLHGAELVVTRATARTDHGDVELEVSPPRADEVLALRPRGEPVLRAGRVTLSLEYTGRIRELQPQVQEPYGYGPQDAAAFGLFRRFAPRAYLFTHAEPAWARHIFPCIDEPDRKVPWRLTLDVRRPLVAVSNTAAVRETPLDDQHKRVEFAPTPPLPSYAIAFAIGPFEIVEGTPSRRGAPIRVLVTEGKAAKAQWAARTAATVLDAMEAWFDAPYAYAKLDLVAVPRFGWGGMEHPGLVTFREPSLLDDENLRLMAHELAHQWFGNLVTHAWWDDMWLNESFAEWLAAKFVETLTFGPQPVDRVDQRANALAGITPSSRHVPRVRPDLVLTDSDSLRAHTRAASWDKGIGVIELFESHLGPEAFRRAINDYVTANAHGTVSSSTLAAALSRAAGQPLDELFGGILSDQIPTLNAHLVCVQGPPHLEVKPLPWPTPVCVAYDRGGKRAETCARVGPDTRSIALPGPSCPRWAYPNAGGLGLYRVGWTPVTKAAVLDRGWRHLTIDERRALVFDLHEEGERLELLVRLFADPRYQPGESELRRLEQLARYVPADLYPRFQAWILRRLRPTKPAPLDARSRGTARATLGLLALAGDPSLVAEARALVAQLPRIPLENLQATLTLAMGADPSLVPRFLSEVVENKLQSWEAHTVMAAIAHQRNLVDLLEHQHALLARLEPFTTAYLLSSTCDPASLAKLKALAARAPTLHLAPAIKEVTWCTSRQSAFDPIFRSWLAPRTLRRRR